MSFVFGLLDFVLTAVLLFDTLGLIYQFRKSMSVEPKEYVRICFSWILFLTIGSLFSCERKGFFGTLIRLIIFASKAFVTLPILGGTMKVHKYLIEDGNADKYINKVTEFIKSKASTGAKTLSENASNLMNQAQSSVSETINNIKSDGPETPTES
jgi:hypothetical protein